MSAAQSVEGLAGIMQIFTVSAPRSSRKNPDQDAAVCLGAGKAEKFRISAEKWLYKENWPASFRAPVGTRNRFNHTPFPVMKVLSSLASAKRRHADCQVVKRKGTVYVICKSNPKFKARQGATPGTRLSKKGL